MLTCVTCSSAKQAFKEITTHMKGMVFKAFKVYRHLKPRTVVNETISMAMETMTTCSEKNGGVASPEEEDQIKEWEVEVDSGVFITFISRHPGGGNLIKKIRFSKENFNSVGAKMWWMEHHERITELYSVKMTNLPWESVTGSTEDNLVASSISNEADPAQTRCNSFDSVQNSTPIQSSGTTSSSATSSDSEFDEEWDEQDEHEPGVSMTIRSYADGTRKIKHVYFSPEKFDEETSVAWWEENKARVYDRYVVFFVF